MSKSDANTSESLLEHIGNISEHVLELQANTSENILGPQPRVLSDASSVSLLRQQDREKHNRDEKARRQVLDDKQQEATKKLVELGFLRACAPKSRFGDGMEN